MSDAGRANRLSADSSGLVSRHTGGSMGNDERRIRLSKKLGRPPTFVELYCDTHLTAEAKKKFWAGEYDSVEMLEFCTSKAKDAYEAYVSAMCQKYGDDRTKHPTDDVDVWMCAQEGRSKSKRIFGIGSSDVNFVIAGTSFSQQGSGPTTAQYEQSQRRVQELEEQLSVMAERQSRFEDQMAEILRKIGNNPSNNP